MNLKSLEELGLTKAQSKIYLELMKIKRSSVLALSQRTHLQRATIYDNLRSLEGLGLVFWSISGKRKQVEVFPPQKLLSLIEQKQRLVRGLLPDLENLYSSSNLQSPEISFFHGTEGFKRLADIIPMTQDKIIRSMGSYIENIELGFSNKYLKKLWDGRTRKKIQARVLFTEADLPRLRRSKDYSEIGNIRYNREVRILPKDINLSVLYTISDDKVLFWSSSREGYGLLFQSLSYAESLKTIFDFLWSVSKPL